MTARSPMLVSMKQLFMQHFTLVCDLNMLMSIDDELDEIIIKNQRKLTASSSPSKNNQRLFEEYATDLLLLAEISVTMKKIDLGKKYAKTAQELIEKLMGKKDRLVAVAMDISAAAMAEDWNFTGARRVLDEALAHRKANIAIDGFARDIGISLIHQADLIVAELDYKRMMRLSGDNEGEKGKRKEGEEDGKKEEPTKSSSALQPREKQQLEIARQKYIEASKILQAPGNEGGMCLPRCLASVGKMSARLGEWKKALSPLRQAMIFYRIVLPREVAEEIDAEHLLLHTIRHLGLSAALFTDLLRGRNAAKEDPDKLAVKSLNNTENANFLRLRENCRLIYFLRTNRLQEQAKTDAYLKRVLLEMERERRLSLQYFQQGTSDRKATFEEEEEEEGGGKASDGGPVAAAAQASPVETKREDAQVMEEALDEVHDTLINFYKNGNIPASDMFLNEKDPEKFIESMRQFSAAMDANGLGVNSAAIHSKFAAHLVDFNRVDEAEKEYKLSLDIFRSLDAAGQRHLGDEFHLYIAKVARAVGDRYAAEKKWKECIPFYDSVLARSDRKINFSEDDMRAVNRGLAIAFMELKQYGDALSHWERAKKGAKTVSLQLCSDYDHIADCLIAVGRRSDSLEYLHVSDRYILNKKKTEPQNFSIHYPTDVDGPEKLMCYQSMADRIYKIAICYKELGEWSKCLYFFEELYDIIKDYTRKGDSTHPDVVVTLMSIANINVRLGDALVAEDPSKFKNQHYDVAQCHYHDCVNLKVRICGTEFHREVLRVLLKHAMVTAKMHEYEEAQRQLNHLKESLQKCEPPPKPTEPLVKECNEQIEKVAKMMREGGGGV